MFTSIRIIWRACGQWSANGDARLGAALAYYALFSIAPVLVIAVTIAGAVFGEEAAKGHVETHLRDIVGEDTAKAIEKLVENAGKPRSGGWAPAVSIVLLVIGALTIFVHLRGALCSIWKLEPPRGNSVLGFLWDYTLALFMVFFCGVLLLASLAASMLVAIFHDTLSNWMPGLPWDWVEFGLSFLYLTLYFAALYRILSGGRISSRYVIYGSFIAAILFTIGKTLLGWYFLYSATVSAYGAAGTLVVFLIWVYYSAQILYFGGELIQARRTRHEWMASSCSPLPRNL